MSPFRSRATVVAIAAMLCIGIAGCEGETSGNGGTTGGEGSYPNIPHTVLTAEEQASYDRLMGELIGANDLASGQLASYWSSMWPRVVTGGLHRNPTQVVAYEGGSQLSGCGALAPENAYFCPTDTSIYYDDNFFRALFLHFGPGAPAWVMAHEWGHHVQHQLVEHEFTVQAELQADCLAGMFFGNGYATDVFDVSAFRAAGVVIDALADDDYQASEWFAPDVHGPTSWRGKAFIDGALGEIDFCRDYEDWTERGTEPLGTYRWLPAPNVVVEQLENDVLRATLRTQTALLSPLAGAGGRTAVDFMPDAMQFWFTGTATPVGQVIDIPTGPGMGGSLGGTGAVQAYQYTDSAGAPAHGMLFVHVATTGEAAGVNVSGAGQPPAMDPTDPAWNPLVNYMWVVGLSLCPPDGAGAFCFALGGP